MDMEANKRLEEVLRHTGLNANSLSKEIDIPKYRIYNILQGRTQTISYEIADKIVSHYATLSKDWLLTGEGEMLVSEGTTVTGNGNAVNTITGNGNKVSASVAGDFADLAGKFATSLQIAQNQLTSSQSQLAKSQEQMDRLIALLEKVTSSKNP